ncbi:MAG: recombination regulator RecX [Acidobacteriia bacterium]|nr:recombination regulator RecX [Terriglobia bacterium]
MAFGRAKKFNDEAGLYEYAVGALGRRMRSVAELKRLLRRRVEADELGAALVELVIAKLKEQRYLNDAQYASTYSSLRRENDKFGRRRVITELRSRGVHSEVIDKAVAGVYDGVNEETQARAYLRRKRLQRPTDQKQAARVFRSLIRAGFGTRTIISILKKWDVDEEVLTALESEEQ